TTDGKDADGPRVYARLANKDLVFLLDPKQTQQVLGEYRSRTIWTTPLDAAQVESLHYASAQNPFLLQKLENVWHVAGKPALKVDSEAVSKTLAALGSLQVARYVVDKDADLKLYGLEPPNLVLEIQTPTGKQVLHIGHVEGDSTRYYAHLPGEGRSEVFVLSEADSAQIVRGLAAFTAK